MSSVRKLPYSLAINEALHQMMEADDSVFLIGQGVRSPWYVGNTAKGLLQRFGSRRVIDTPVSENAITGSAVGAAICGMRPVVVHPRMDFMLYALDPIINEAANWSYMNGGCGPVPLVVWAIINRGGEQAAQHSQALHAVFSHVPGLKVVMPATAYDAKGLMISAIRDDSPVIFIDDRWLYRMEEDVPEGIYEVPIGKGAVRRKGKDVTVAGISYLAAEAVKAGNELAKEGIDAEVIDLRSAKPLDRALILDSVRKTRRLVVCDPGWKSFGLSAEVSALVSESGITLEAPVARVCLPDAPAPASKSLETVYYPDSAAVMKAVRDTITYRRNNGKV